MSEVSPQQQREYRDPHENNGPLPWFIIALATLLGAFGVGYIFVARPQAPAAWGDGRSIDELQGAAIAEGPTTSLDGAALFASRCAVCHQASGEGLAGVFPPLAGSEWVMGRDRTLVAIVLNGIQGALTVKSQTYNGVMPPFKDLLSDAEIAAIATHLRGSWGNTAAAIATDVVTEVRQETTGHAPFQGDEELAALAK